MIDIDSRPLSVYAAAARPARRRRDSSRTGIAVSMFLVAAAGLLLQGRPLSAEESTPAGMQPQTGEAIYQMRCAPCHPDQGNVIDPAKPVRGSAKLKDLQTFISWIRTPVVPMTAFSPETISDQKAGELYRYLAPPPPAKP